MILSDSRRRFRLMNVVLLVTVFLAGCSQSIPSSGESIDSASGRSEAGRGTFATESPIGSHLSVRQSQASEAVSDRLEEDSDSANDGRGESNHELLEDAGSQLKEEDGIKANSGTVASAEAESSGQAPASPERTVTDPVQTASASAAPPEDQPDSTRSDSTVTESETSANRSQAEGETTGESEVAQEQEEMPEKKWSGDNKLTFGELYASVGVRGITLSEKVEALTGQQVEMNGYMAPPLTAGVRFFVLTKTLMAVCPFCSTDADWPTDMVVVYLPDGEDLMPTEHPVKVTGRLDTGSYTDEDTGFVSLVRIYADQVEVIR